jgi:hypothetical protein
MRLMLAALLLTAAPLSAQSASDTAAIRRAVADSGLAVSRVRIVVDTAWASVYDPRRLRDTLVVTDNSITRGTMAKAWDVRLERRKGQWVALTSIKRPNDAPSASDSAAISAAARTVTPRSDGTGYPDRIQVKGDTAWATVWLTRSKGQRVRVERRNTQWQALKSDTTTVILLKHSARSPARVVMLTAKDSAAIRVAAARLVAADTTERHHFDMRGERALVGVWQGASGDFVWVERRNGRWVATGVAASGVR